MTRTEQSPLSNFYKKPLGHDSKSIESSSISVSAESIKKSSVKTTLKQEEIECGYNNFQNQILNSEPNEMLASNLCSQRSIDQCAKSEEGRKSSIDDAIMNSNQDGVKIPKENNENYKHY